MKKISYFRSLVKNSRNTDQRPSIRFQDDENGSGDILNHVLNFEVALERISDIPENFRRLMPLFETFAQELSDNKERCSVFQEALKEEQNKNSELLVNAETTKHDIERLEYSLQRETSALAAERQKNIDLEGSASSLRLSNADLTSRLGRLEPLARELTITKETLLSQLEKLDGQKQQSDKDVADSRHEQIRLREQNAKLVEKTNNLVTERQNLSERLEQVSKALSEKDSIIASDKEQIASLVAKLKREAMISRSLSSENDQLIKERDDLRTQNESQLEAARGRYRVLERLLEESRIRYQSESHALSSERREKSQREYEVVQLNATIASSREEITDLRRQVLTSAELLAGMEAERTLEIKKRRKLEIELEVAREESAKHSAALKSSAIDFENRDLQYEMRFSELKGAADAVRVENERLRAELEGYRFANKADNLAEDAEASRVVSMAR